MYYAFLPTYSYHLSVLRLWAVAISEAFLLSVLSFFTVGMENNNEIFVPVDEPYLLKG